MSEDERREVERAMMRRALGYETEECVEEYAPEGEGGIPVLVKRRITKKEVAGDVSAAKLLLAPEPGGSDGAAEAFYAMEADVAHGYAKGGAIDKQFTELLRRVIALENK